MIEVSHCSIDFIQYKFKLFIIQSNINHSVFILASKIDSSKMFHEYFARQKCYSMNLQFVICYSDIPAI